MGLIINKNIPMLKAGYPTVSDKYNVAGAVLAGTASVSFGDLVKFSTTKGYYEKATAMTAVTDAAGFVVATNVKLNMTYGGENVVTVPGEAFNLLVNGFMAINLDAGATVANIKPNATVAVTLATGVCTTNDKVSGSTVVLLPNVYFTGTYEMHGTTVCAEIYVKC